ncbi:HicB family protein [Methanohalophilus halophilus]|nr:HicB family protein [Methanohalophilus halophilus]RNI08492.1 type II toxin-antitoxin system HicB family antitoxin [Methanohalophilus halophilus]
MLLEYIQTALARAKYDIIEDDEEPYYGEISELEGVWATGTSLEECRKNLEEIIGEWLILRLRRNLPIPPLGNFKNCDHR